MYEYRAKVTGVYDGDTITCDIDLGFYCWLKNQKIRLVGIDTPEIRGSERARGLLARNKLRELILGKEVIILSKKAKKGKYGRWLGTIFTIEGMNVNYYLIENGFAIEVIY